MTRQLRSSSPTPDPVRALIASRGPSLCGYARAAGFDEDATAVAVRAAFASVSPDAAASGPTNAATLLVALGRATASLVSNDTGTPPDAPSPAIGRSPFGRAFRSLRWQTKVAVWSSAVDDISPGVIAAALGPDADAASDPSRQLLRAYLLELAGVSFGECADALYGALRQVDYASLRRIGELDPHLATCAVCRSAFPLRAAPELEALGSPQLPIPTELARQIALDRTVSSDAPARPRATPVAVGVASAAVILAAIAAWSAVPRSPRPRLVGAISTSEPTTVTDGPSTSDLPGRAGSVALGAALPTVAPTTTIRVASSFSATAAARRPSTGRNPRRPPPPAAPTAATTTTQSPPQSTIAAQATPTIPLTTAPLTWPTTSITTAPSTTAAIPSTTATPDPTTTAPAPTTTTTTPATTALPTTTVPSGAAPAASAGIPLLWPLVVLVPGVGLPMGARRRRLRR